MTNVKAAIVPEAGRAGAEGTDPSALNVISNAELRAPLVSYSASGENLSIEVKENISILSVRGILDQAGERSDLSRGQPPVETLSQVVAHPRYTALYDAEGKILPESSMYAMSANTPQSVRSKFSKSREIRNFEPQAIDISDVEVSDATVAFGGSPHPHFGHHLVDGMSRHWYHSEHPTLWLDAHLKARGDHGFVSDLLALGRPRNLLHLQKPTMFASVILPHAAIQNAFLIYDNADTEHLAIAQSALERAHNPVPSKVYLSRRGIDNRPCRGEEELERRLSSFGFAILRPETLRVVDQIALFNLADWIVGATGSAFHNLLFTRRGAPTRTVQITVKKPDLRYLLIDRVKGHASYYARTMHSEAESKGKIMATRVDVEETLDVLRAIGTL